jgi:hypothetical protein
MAVVISAKKLSAFGADWATKMGGHLSFGAVSFAGRVGAGTIIGRGLLGNRFIKTGAVSNNKLIRYSSRLAGFTGKRLQNRTYDIRNVSGATSALGLGVTTIDAGPGAKYTAKQLQEKQYGWKPTAEWFREASKQYEKDANALKKDAAISDPTNPDFTKTMKKLSVDELAELRAIRKGLVDYVKTLSPAKYDELQKSDKLLDSEKENLKKTWEDQFMPGNVVATMARFTTEEIAGLSSSLLKRPDVIATLGNTEFEAIRRKGNLTAVDRKEIHRQMGMIALANPATFGVMFNDYFNPTNDIGGGRKKYWDV